MANIMNMVNLKNNVHRSGFDLSRRNCFTAKVGEILPVMCEEVLPGDKLRINMREFMRTAPVQTATFGRVRQYYDFYFVPYNLLWDKWESWIMQTKNAFHAKSLYEALDDFPTHPYMGLDAMLNCLSNMQSNGNKWYVDYSGPAKTQSDQSVYKDTCKLLQYLGYPITKSSGLTVNLALNPFPLLAYQKIYQDYFRFSQWEDAAPWTYNLDYILRSSQLSLSLGEVISNSLKPNIFTLRYCNLDKDYFNGLLPSPQYGDTAMAGPLSFLGSSSKMSGSLAANFGLLPKVSGKTYEDLSVGPADLGSKLSYTGTPLNRFVSASSTNAVFSGKLEVDNVGLSILLLRQAEALQKWKEITISGDLDYKTQLQKHWNVNISDDNSYMCKYLGGIANNVDISEVINTNLVAEDSEAEIHGKGVSASDGNINFSSHQYGVIMCVYHCKPIIEWNSNNVLPRMLTKSKATDYAIPEFDQIGMESVLRGQFIYNAAQNWSQPIGYAPRYIDYKTSFDRINGEFQDSLKPWVIPHTIVATSGNAVTYKTFKVSPTILDNMFGVNASEADQFRCTVYFDFKAVRNLDRDGLPY
nr:MAG TPA: Major capsid protein [Microviridae sp.]